LHAVGCLFSYVVPVQCCRNRTRMLMGDSSKSDVSCLISFRFLFRIVVSQYVVCAAFADVRDDKVWRAAEVINEKENDIYFRFLAWKEFGVLNLRTCFDTFVAGQKRWNVWLPKEPPLIVPPFQYVRGDTSHKAQIREGRDLDCRGNV